MTVWGLHMGRHVGMRPVEQGYVAIGWKEMGDLRSYPTKEAYRAKLQALNLYSQGAIPVYCGLFIRYVQEMKKGDIVVYPSKYDRRIYIGELTGDSDFQLDDIDEYPNKRSVKWIIDFPRDHFSQDALKIFFLFQSEV